MFLSPLSVVLSAGMAIAICFYCGWIDASLLASDSSFFRDRGRGLVVVDGGLRHVDVLDSAIDVFCVPSSASVNDVCASACGPAPRPNP